MNSSSTTAVPNVSEGPIAVPSRVRPSMKRTVIPPLVAAVLADNPDLKLSHLGGWTRDSGTFEIRMPLVDQTRYKHLTLDSDTLDGDWIITMCGDGNTYVGDYPDKSPDYARHIAGLWLRAADLCDRLNAEAK
jgi:hypothetical protein